MAGKLLTAVFGFAQLGMASACSVGDQCYSVPVSGAFSTDPQSVITCSADCKCEMVPGRFRVPRHVSCPGCPFPSVQGNPATCQDGVLDCAASDKPTTNKTGCLPRTWRILQVQETWAWSEPEGGEVGFDDGSDGLRVAAGDWGSALTTYLQSHAVDFLVGENVVARRPGKELARYKDAWEQPIYPMQDQTVESVIWTQSFFITDNFGGSDSALSLVVIRTNNYIVNDKTPCCFPGFCADKACNTCTAEDKMIPGSDLVRCKVSSDVGLMI